MATIKINKSEIISDSINYKCITGAILNTDKTGFLVKTRDSFIKITEYTSSTPIRAGDRFECK